MFFHSFDIVSVKASPRSGPVTQIPRFAAFLAKKKQEQKKPITPGLVLWCSCCMLFIGQSLDT